MEHHLNEQLMKTEHEWCAHILGVIHITSQSSPLRATELNVLQFLKTRDEEFAHIFLAAASGEYTSSMSHLLTGTGTGRFAPADRVRQNCSAPDLALSRGCKADGRGYRAATAQTVEKVVEADVANVSLSSCRLTTRRYLTKFTNPRCPTMFGKKIDT